MSLGNVFIIGLLMASVVLSVFASGCAPDTPEAAAQSFFNAVESGDFGAFLDSVAPERVRRMSAEEKTMQEELLKSGESKYEGLKFEAKIDRKDKNKAVVTITAGKMTQKNPMTGEEQVVEFDKYEEEFGEPATLDAVKYKNRWYMDIPLSQSDVPEEGEIQMEEQSIEEGQNPGQ
ncbi:MAG: DUF4878 domain-containing protein [Actinobacteria bacterium]|nr:DUF4878 domain-containing protein [Actinomycetota bacterium]